MRVCTLKYWILFSTFFFFSKVELHYLNHQDHEYRKKKKKKKKGRKYNKI
jgi:hypothetical protein